LHGHGSVRIRQPDRRPPPAGFSLVAGVVGGGRATWTGRDRDTERRGLCHVGSAASMAVGPFAFAGDSSSSGWRPLHGQRPAPRVGRKASSRDRVRVSPTRPTPTTTFYSRDLFYSMYSFMTQLMRLPSHMSFMVMKLLSHVMKLLHLMTLPSQQICLCSNLFNVHDTLMKLALRLA